MKKILRGALAAVLTLSLLGITGCIRWWGTDAGVSGNDGNKVIGSLGEAPYGPYDKKDGTWAIYWYICGSDLELRENLQYTPTGQIQEMLNVTLPDNVTAVVETGGAKRWHNDFTNPDVLNRFVYRGNTLTTLESQPLASMGDGRTLADFLAFCNQNYPAEKQVVIIYDHGGGSCMGVAFDDLFNNDGITLSELKDAISSRPAASGAYELVGLSACLMGTIETVGVLNGLARYYVASEEVQLGCSWDYGALFSAIAEDTTINGAALGKAIADGYLKQCEQVGYTAYTTLSVIDMARADDLLTAYNDVGIELLRGAVENGEEFIASFGRAAYDSENYGAVNSPTSKYDMVDLGDLVDHAKDMLPNSSQAMIQAIYKAVTYKVNNPMRANGHGISCYYPYTAKQTWLNAYREISTSPAFGYYFEYQLSGSLSQEGQDYLKSVNKPTTGPEPEPLPKPQPLPEPSALGLDDRPLTVYEDGYWWLELDDDVDSVAAVFLQLYVLDQATEDIILFGTRHDISAFWDYGLFRDEFTGSWGSIDGALCYMEAIAADDGYILYQVPVYHNGVLKDMMVLYSWDGEDFYEGEYEILGIISMNDDKDGVPDPTFEELKIGDVVEPALSRLTVRSGYNEEISGPGDPATHPITVKRDTRFSDMSLGDGIYLIAFLIFDYTGTEHLTDFGYYVVAEGIFFAEAEDGSIVYR